MRAFIGFGVLAVIGVGALVVWVARRVRQSDPAWKATGYRYLYTGHDQALGQQSAMRAADTASRRLVLASERSMPLATPPGTRAASHASGAVATARRVANLVDMRERRAAR
jgi:hypothetical protein